LKRIIQNLSKTNELILEKLNSQIDGVEYAVLNLSPTLNRHVNKSEKYPILLDITNLPEKQDPNHRDIYAANMIIYDESIYDEMFKISEVAFQSGEFYYALDDFTFQFIVQKNQLLVDHSVALSFTGTNSKASILQPFVKAGNISVEFWLRNATTASSVLLSQENSFSISVSATKMTFAVGNQSITGDINNDGSYHHYTCSYDAINGRLSIIQDDAIIKSEVKASNLLLDNNNAIKIGGTSFIGKIHELRLWNSVISRETAVANMYASLIGNEDGLMGNWPMNEGNGILAKDGARFKHISL
jgi:hypothetical protein